MYNVRVGGDPSANRVGACKLSLGADMRTAIVALSLGVMASLGECQLVSVGPPDPHFCDKLKVQPNLTVGLDTSIQGHLIDASGVPLRNSPIELRAFQSPTKQVLAAKAMTDADGSFLVYDLKAGKYRLVAVQAPGFKQAEPQRCTSRPCKLEIVLRLAPTDTPWSICPAR